MTVTTGTAGKAIACMLAGTLMLTTQDAVSKWLTGRFHAGEILIYRGVFGYIAIAVYAHYAGLGWRVMRTRQPFGNLARASLNTAAGLLVITAYKVMPLADALAITFASPLLITALSGPLLKEQVDWRRWAAVIGGFAGILLMCRPDGGVFKAVVILPILCMFCTAGRDLLTRRLGAVDAPATILFFTITTSVVAGAISLPIAGATWPTPTEWLIFFILGQANGISHFLVIQAFSLAPASTLAPFRYLSLVWAVAIGAVVWGDFPDEWKLAGAGLVVMSGLYVVRRETRRVAR